MTVVAWDGETLAADKRGLLSNSLHRTVTKIQLYGRVLLAITGDWDIGCELREWYKAGAIPRDFPVSARNNDATLIAITRTSGVKISLYTSGPYPLDVENKRCAWGSGRDFAEAAMYLGKTAVEAVEVACIFQSDCGNGIDTRTFI